MIPQPTTGSTSAPAFRLFPAMTDTDPCKAAEVVDEFVARLAAGDLSDRDRKAACEAALKHLMGYLIDREGWLAEEFSGLARSLGAY
ncbi:hypothetical protein [Azospirillum sp. TSO35-2]|uniref:hypothetical protein n=1 Tax=Azospirillum sp. TSO35-2 TaxID=716796 RepID=UPI000D619970|nr:hypothetical protein [Azospirillum sp. TSO35-2]PWC35870.1 hypothetical protein TSO352_11625 [Azospirillum sp. TSO35-2]